VFFSFIFLQANATADEIKKAFRKYAMLWCAPVLVRCTEQQYCRRMKLSLSSPLVVLLSALAECTAKLFFLCAAPAHRLQAKRAIASTSAVLLHRHPDKAGNVSEAEREERNARMKEINSAYVCLQKGGADISPDEEFFPEYPWNMPDEVLATLYETEADPPRQPSAYMQVFQCRLWTTICSFEVLSLHDRTCGLQDGDLVPVEGP
jgi:hypothetical protein